MALRLPHQKISYNKENYRTQTLRSPEDLLTDLLLRLHEELFLMPHPRILIY